MKSILLSLFTALLLISCSEDSAKQDEDFFNLHQGNLWVYKKYNATVSSIGGSFANITDSVRVDGDTLINNVTFSKLIHNRYNAFNTLFRKEEYLRVDENGHLVNETGYVVHPGLDSQYQNVIPVYADTNLVGTITQQLQSPFTTNVEGTNYFVYSYYGDCAPAFSGGLQPNHIFYQYKQGVGLISQRYSVLSGLYYEDRLVYYDLNQ